MTGRGNVPKNSTHSFDDIPKERIVLSTNKNFFQVPGPIPEGLPRVRQGERRERCQALQPHPD